MEHPNLLNTAKPEAKFKTKCKKCHASRAYMFSTTSLEDYSFGQHTDTALGQHFN